MAKFERAVIHGSSPEELAIFERGRVKKRRERRRRRKKGETGL